MGSAERQEHKESSEILRRLRSGDPQIKAELVDRYTDHLYKASLGLGFDREKAADLTQNVWLTFFEKLESFEGRSQVRSFLFGILYMKAKEMWRELKKQTSQVQIDQMVESRFDSGGNWIKQPLDPQKVLEGQEVQAQIELCSESLNEEQRVIFSLREVEGLSPSEVQESTGLTLRHVGVILFRARNILRECLEKAWKLSSPKSKNV